MFKPFDFGSLVTAQFSGGLGDDIADRTDDAVGMSFGAAEQVAAFAPSSIILPAGFFQDTGSQDDGAQTPVCDHEECDPGECTHDTDAEDGHDHDQATGHTHDHGLADKVYADAVPGEFSNEPADGDLPADTSTTGTVSVGESVTGTRDGRGDQDWFAVELVAGQQYTFILLRDGDSPLTDPFLFLYDASGTLVDSNDDIDIDGDGIGENRNSLIFFTPETTGTYFLGAGGYDAPDATGFTAQGDYTLYVEQGDNRPDFSIEDVAFFLTSQFDNFQRWDQSVITYDVSGLPEGAQTLALAAMELWAEVSGLTFVEAPVAATAQLVFNDDNGENGEQQAFASTQTVNGSIVSSTVTVSENWEVDAAGNPEYDFNTYRFQTYIHEVGHALGLGHAGPYNGIASDSAGVRFNIYNQDAWNYTVMSYFDQSEAGTGTPRLVLGLQAADILAIQSVYGADTTTRADDTVYGFNSTESGLLNFETSFFDAGIRLPSLSIYDAGGEDTLDLSGYATNQVITLVAGDFLSIGDNTNTLDASDPLINNITIAVGTVIENAVGGSGNDTISGNGSDNILEGGEGNDALTGLAGVDVFVFKGDNTGQDTVLDFTAGVDLVNLDGVSGFETFADVQAAASQVGNDTVITLSSGLIVTGVNSVTLLNTDVEDLTFESFVFGPFDRDAAPVRPPVEDLATDFDLSDTALIEEAPVGPSAFETALTSQALPGAGDSWLMNDLSDFG